MIQHKFYFSNYIHDTLGQMGAAHSVLVTLTVSKRASASREGVGSPAIPQHFCHPGVAPHCSCPRRHGYMLHGWAGTWTGRNNGTGRLVARFQELSLHGHTGKEKSRGITAAGLLTTPANRLPATNY
jgi:hypothetical protein